MTIGTFYTIRIHDIDSIPTASNLKIFGVRIAKFLPSDWEHWEGLTPSKKLLFAAKRLEKNNNWNSNTFSEFYLPNFLKEISSSSIARNELKMIQKNLREGKDVYYSCYCKDPQLCHRGVLADLFEKYGYNVVKK